MSIVIIAPDFSVQSSWTLYLPIQSTNEPTNLNKIASKTPTPAVKMTRKNKYIFNPSKPEKIKGNKPFFGGTGSVSGYGLIRFSNHSNSLFITLHTKKSGNKPDPRLANNSFLVMLVCILLLKRL